MGNKNKHTVNRWSDAISNMRTKVKRYYLKTDTERKQPYKLINLSEDFMYEKTYVNFHPIRSDDENTYTLEKERFLENFDEVEEEI